MSGAITATGLAVGLGTAAAGIGGAALASHGANKAADTQANAAQSAAQLQYQASQDALNFQKQQYATSQEQLKPFLESGTAALSNLNYLSGVSTPDGSSPAPNTALGGFGSLMAPYGQTFQAPTGLTEQNDPGYQARLQLGTDALQKSAAARGSVLTGGTAKALDTYAQDYASNEYGNVYNRAYNTFASNYNQDQQQKASTYNRLASLAGVGQQTASQLGYLGQNAANSMANTGMEGAMAVNQQNNNAAAASASGYAANGNIWGNALSGLGTNLSNLYQLRGGGGASSYNPVGTLNPRFSASVTPYGAEPGYTDWSGVANG